MAVYTTNTSTKPAGTRTGVVSDIVRDMAARFQAWRSYRSTVQALSALSDRELDDIGVSRSGIKAAALNKR